MKISVKIFVLLLLGAISVTLTQAQDCDDLYRQGVVAQNRERYSEAIARFEAAAKCNPELQSDCAKKITECKAKLSRQESAPAPKPNDKDKLNVNKKTIFIDANGGIDNIGVEVSAKTWTVNSSESWCKVAKNDNIVSVMCDPNKTLIDRKALVEVKSGNEIQITEILQKAATEYLRASLEGIWFPSVESEKEINITTNAIDWNYSGAPSWVKISKSNDVLKIKVMPNTSNGDLNGKIVIYTPSNKELTIQIYQSARKEEIAGNQKNSEKNDSKISDKKRRKVAFGIMGSYTGSYGEIGDYSLGGSGSGISALVDIHLTKSFYLQTGLEYTALEEKIVDYYSYSATHYWWEVPFTFSLRFNAGLNWQLNAGPYLAYQGGGTACVGFSLGLSFEYKGINLNIGTCKYHTFDYLDYPIDYSRYQVKLGYFFR